MLDEHNRLGTVQGVLGHPERFSGHDEWMGDVLMEVNVKCKGFYPLS